MCDKDTVLSLVSASHGRKDQQERWRILATLLFNLRLERLLGRDTGLGQIVPSQLDFNGTPAFILQI